MEFDKTKVYTSVNAEDLPIGSKCIFANNLNDLRHEVLVRRGNFALQKVLDDSYDLRFVVGVYTYSLAYLIEPPKQAKKQKEPEYKPFSSIEKAMEVINKHGGWVSYKCYSFLVTAYDKDMKNHSVYFANRWYSFQELYDFFVFAEDGTPCGELV